ncbi:type II CRISPR RNA-guided endonuclease Cas9 [Gracilibacillus alcaliphilus]|uniref:type II CRISPR RNA-guided endonuclease Cas9 n=1 Tax=Gracilibacillus alcaliphilus TaxID=1401441 RepID=UPI00195DE3BE|nr:type II CRISPR RNA-guided endonuclease Cas9 [Gracilibacillus alcaliphilus]MBM7676563.1 CRISPR-associated endonuclease Csn1 [Gracilibacillus alcaliphilus]
MKYDIGLDIGITSVGWAVINRDKERLEDWGVRLFEVAENPKDGSALAAPRREARSTRRRLRRRKHRIERIRHFIIQSKLLTEEELLTLYPLTEKDEDIWVLRKLGTERKLSTREFARILIHCAKHRGYQSNRKSEEQDDESGKVLSAIKENHALMIEKGYRTISHMLVAENRPLRNKDGDYSGVLLRSDIRKEISEIFDVQQELGHSFANEINKERYIELWGSQRPFASKDDIFAKIGTCSIEKNAKRAPKATYTFSKFRALDKLNRLQIIDVNGEKRKLTREERELVISKFFDKKEAKYQDIRKALKLADDERFSELYYAEDENVAQSEKRTFISMEEQYKIRQMIKKELGKKRLEELLPIDFDTFGYALTVFKNDEDIRDYLHNEFINSKKKATKNLANRRYEDDMIDVLLKLSFSKFSHLSLKALDKILPFMELGDYYSEAVEKAGYKLDEQKNLPKQKLLPVIPEGEIPNPIVLRALSQARKVVNSIIKKYGSPHHIYIELAREMGRNHQERKNIEKEFNKNRTINEKAKQKISELFPEKSEIKGHDILKVKLWEEQQGCCIYSRKSIPFEKLLEPGYVQVDHIIPYSRSFNDSNHNKVLVLSDQNQGKKNKTPFEWFGFDERRWNDFANFVDSLNMNKKKKQNLKNKSFTRNEKEFRDRHLNDTRYITRFLKTFISDYLRFDSNSKQNVYPVNGAYTAVLRKRWGFNKDREENSLHHALDAAIVATSGPFRQKVSEYFKQHEEGQKQALKRMNIRFPQPWSGFVRELRTRLIQDPEQLMTMVINNNFYEDDPAFREQLKPIFPSWMPKRSVKGQLHKEKFRRNRGETDDGYQLIVTKTKLENIPFDKEGHFPMYGKDSDRKTYEAIRNRYLDFDGNKQKAFAEPLYKPSKNMKNAPLIRSVKIEEKKSLFVSVKGDKTIAYNSNIARTDVYQDVNTKKYYLLPVYVADIKQGNVPDRFITALKPYSQWVKKEKKHQYKFSLFPHDLIYIQLNKSKKTKTKKNTNMEWDKGYFYYKGLDSATGAISIVKFDHSFEERTGVKSLKQFDKYNITPIGDLQKVQKEVAYGL